MFKKHLFLKLIACTMLVAVIVGFAALASGAGSTAGTSSDPLVTLSYVDEIFRESLLSEVQKMISDSSANDAQRLNQMLAGFIAAMPRSTAVSSAQSSYESVSLQVGQTWTFAEGQQFLLLSGSAVLTSNRLVDVTDGKSIASGAALAEDHFYTVPAEATVRAETELSILVK